MINVKNILKNLPGCLYWKDLNSNYLGCNEEFAKIAYLNDAKDIIGMSDHDMHWNKQASLFQSEDSIAMNRHLLGNIETTLIIQDKLVDYLVTKKALCDDRGALIGMIGHATVIEKIKIDEDFFNAGIERKFKDTSNVFKKFFLDRMEVQLTEREINCLVYFVKGYTVAEIAGIMHRSKRTIETHIEHIKNKFGCRKKSELISKVLEKSMMAKLFVDSRFF